jgi:ABC-type glycerol-3-phosphate transport system substrate-binding protein
MKSQHIRWLIGAAALGAAACLSACNDDSSSSTASTPPGSVTTEIFSKFAEQTFEVSANATPVNFDSITLIYDVNDNPTAFNNLLM